MTTRVQLVGSGGPAVTALAGSLAATLHDRGFQVELCAGYPQARRWLDESCDGPAAVVVALDRPDRSSLALCRELRRVAPWLVIIAISSAMESRDVVAALEAGADDCVPRPFHPLEVAARLRAHLRRRTVDGGAPCRRPVPADRLDPAGGPGRPRTTEHR